MKEGKSHDPGSDKHGGHHNKDILSK